MREYELNCTELALPNRTRRNTLQNIFESSETFKFSKYTFCHAITSQIWTSLSVNPA